MTARERVERWAPEEARIGEYRHIEVEGLELFWVYLSEPHDNDKGYGAVVVPGETDPLRGKEAFRAARAQSGDDPVVLAHLAQLLLDGGGAPIVDPAKADEDPHGQAEAPRVEDGRLVFWSVWRQTSSHPELVRMRVDLETLELETTGAQALRRRQMSPTESARHDLAGKNPRLAERAVDDLAEHCEDADAADLLREVVAGHEAAQARKRAAEVLADCPGENTVAALEQALRSDADAEVRWRAARSLGTLGADSARSSLEQASQQDDDPTVRRVAAKALRALGS